jgi:hypothetical protein
MFPLEVTNVPKSLKIDTMGIWRTYLSVNLNPSK